MASQRSRVHDDTSAAPGTGEPERDTVLGTATEQNGPLSMPTDWWTTGQVGSAQARLVDRVPYRFAQRERERAVH
jgi:hypothetical protein